MAQFETTGGGFLDSGDRKVIRKAYVATDNQAINVPASVDGFPLSSVSSSEDVAGVRRVIAEYSQGGEGGASYNAYGKRIELTGGTREVPIQTHKKFESMTDQEIAEVQEAVEAGTAAVLTGFTADQELLYSFLSRGVEYVLAPAVVGRISEIESTLPNLSPIAKTANPSELDAPSGTFWICTAITATPIGTRYEVTREYTLNFSAWADVATLYGWS
jgi:hypothetical protein